MLSDWNGHRIELLWWLVRFFFLRKYEMEDSLFLVFCLHFFCFGKFRFIFDSARRRRKKKKKSHTCGWPSVINVFSLTNRRIYVVFGNQKKNKTKRKEKKIEKKVERCLETHPFRRITSCFFFTFFLLFFLRYVCVFMEPTKTKKKQTKKNDAIFFSFFLFFFSGRTCSFGRGPM